MPIQSIHLTVVDGENHTSLVTVNIDGSVSVANATTFATTFAGLVEAVIEGVVTKATLTQVLFTSGIGTPDPLSDVEVKAKFIFDAIGTTKNLIMSIPTFLRSKLQPNSSLVNQADTDVAALIDAVVDGITVGGSAIQPKDTENRDILGILVAEEAYSKKRKS